MSKPLGQMPYETAGDLILTFPDSTAVENYRRDLNLDTAVATVEYTATAARGSRARSLPAPWIKSSSCGSRRTRRARSTSPPDCRTPQKVDHRNRIRKHPGDARHERRPLQGIKGALKFQVRARVLADGGTTQRHFQFRQRRQRGFGHDPDRRGNELQELPGRERRSRRPSSSARSPPPPKRHLTSSSPPTRKEHQRLFRRVSLDLGSQRRHETADRRAHQEFRERQRSAVRRALFPVWPLPADQLFASRRPAGQSAGHLESTA